MSDPLVKRRLTAEEWAAARLRWQGAEAEGFDWLAAEIGAAWGVSITRQACSEMARRKGWTKGGPPAAPLATTNAAAPAENAQEGQPGRARSRRANDLAQEPRAADAEAPAGLRLVRSDPAGGVETAQPHRVDLPPGAKPPGYAGVGRPSKYRPEYAAQILDFFDVEPFRRVEVEGRSGPRLELVPNAFPMLQRFAYSIGVSVDTLNRWATDRAPDGSHRYPDFAEAYARARELQEALLVEGAMAGAFDSRFSSFAAKNLFGWKDKTEVAVEVEPVSVEHLEELFVKRMAAAQERMAEVYAQRRAARLARVEVGAG